MPPIVIINRIYDTQSSVAVACFFPGRAKDLSAPMYSVHGVSANNTFLIISHSVLLQMRNVSDKSCRENQNTFYVQ